MISLSLSGDCITGEAVSFQINVQNAAEVYSVTVESTTDGSTVTIVDEKPIISDINIKSNNPNDTKAMLGDIITLTFRADEPVTKLSNFKINGSNPDSFTNEGNIYKATHLVDEGDLITGEAATFQINVKNAYGIYSLTVEATTDGSSVTIIEKMPRISNVSIFSNNAQNPNVAMLGDIITLQFEADEAVTKLSNFKINGSNPDSFTNEGSVYTATHLVDEGDPINGLPVTFQINVENAAGIYSYTIEVTNDGSSVTVVGQTINFQGTVYASDFDRNLSNNMSIQGANIRLTKQEMTPQIMAASSDATTAADGSFMISLERGIYVLEVSKEGYVSYIDNDFVIEEADIDMDIYLDALPQTSTLTGMVTIADEDTITGNNAALPNVSVMLTKIGSSSTGTQTTVTSSNGTYLFSDLACGLYEITVRDEGYITVNSEILISSPGITTYNITLEAISNSYTFTDLNCMSYIRYPEANTSRSLNNFSRMLVPEIKTKDYELNYAVE